MTVLQWFVLLSVVGLIQSSSPEETCEVSFEKIGCYNDKTDNRSLRILDLNVRGAINWTDGDPWEKYLKSLACRCAKQSRAHGQSHFGLQFYGECWSDERAFERFDLHGKSDPGGCVGFQYNNCNDQDNNECVGGSNRNYVYRILKVADGSIRLVGGANKGEGRVEIYHNGLWGTVCDDEWGMEEAQVVCRQQGFLSALSAPRNAHFGEGSGMIWVDEIRCKGSEQFLKHCEILDWGWANIACYHYEDASVVCSDEG